MEGLLASYEQGVKSMTPIFSVAARFLDANSDQGTEKIQLRETLARNGNLRKKDFDRMMTAITGPQNDRAGEVRVLLRDFVHTQQEWIEQLSGYFAQIRGAMEAGDIEKIKPVFVRIREIVALQEQARQQLEGELAEHEKEQQEVHSGVKSLLRNGNEVQVPDFKVMLAGIKRQRETRIEENRLRRDAVAQMLASYKKQRLESENLRKLQ